MNLTRPGNALAPRVYEFKTGDVLIAFGIVGAFFVAYGFYILAQIGLSQSWPSVDGRIVKSELIPDKRSHNNVTISIEFSYELDGKQFASDNWNFGARGQYISRTDAQKVVAKYPVGRIMPVHYDPDDPSMAVLERADLSYGFMFCGIGAAFPFGALAFIRLRGVVSRILGF